MELPKETRLRYVYSKDPSKFELWLQALGSRVQIYNMVWNGKAWYLWFVPNDKGADVKSFNLDEV